MTTWSGSPPGVSPMTLTLCRMLTVVATSRWASSPAAAASASASPTSRVAPITGMSSPSGKIRVGRRTWSGPHSGYATMSAAAPAAWA